MNPAQLPFEEKIILTGPGEAFPIPLAYKGSVFYFDQEARIEVPANLQAPLAVALDTAFRAETFTERKDGNTEIGRVTVHDGDKKRIFEMTIVLTETPKDDYFSIKSIVEVME